MFGNFYKLISSFVSNQTAKHPAVCNVDFNTDTMLTGVNLVTLLMIDISNTTKLNAT